MIIMAKLTTPKGKLVRKFGDNIFGNPKYDNLLNRKPSIIIYFSPRL